MQQLNGNYFKINHHILEIEIFRDLSDKAKILYLYLCKLSNRFADYEGYFHTGERTLSNMAGMTRRTIRIKREELSQATLIEFQISSRTKYRVLK